MGLSTDFASNYFFQFMYDAFDGNAVEHFLKEALDDHSFSLGPGKAAGHQIEDVLVLDLCGGGRMRTSNIVGLDFQARYAVGAGAAIQDQIAVALEGVSLLCAGQHFDDAHVDAASAMFEGTIEQQVTEAVGNAVQLQRLVVNVLAAGGEVEPQQFAMSAFAAHVQVEEGFGQAAAPTHLNPTQIGIFAHYGTAGEEVPGGMLEILQVHVTDLGIVLQNQLYDSGLEGVLGAQEVIDHGYFGAFFGHQECVVIAADAFALVQDRLQGKHNFGVAGHEDEGPGVPQRCVKGCEFVGVRLYCLGHEVATHELWMLLHGRLQVGKDNALLFEVLVFPAVYDAAVTIEQAGGGVHLVQGVEQDRVQLIEPEGPARGGEWRVVVKIKAGQTSAPPVFVGWFGPGQALERLPGAQAEVQHPSGFVFSCRCLPHGFLRESGGCFDDFFRFLYKYSHIQLTPLCKTGDIRSEANSRCAMRVQVCMPLRA